MSSSRDRLSSKASLLLTSEIVGLFVNTLTAGDKYTFHNMKQPIEKQLSKKQKLFWFFIAYLEFISNFEQLEKNVIIGA